MLTRASLVQREHGLCLRVNRWCAYRVVRLYFKAVSRLGDGVFWYTLMLLMPVLDPQRGWQASLHMAIVGILCLLLYRALKRWSRRPRPLHRHRGIEAPVAPLDEFSFPSGHTLHAVAFSAVAIAYLPILAWLLLPFALSVAASRIVLGLHYPSDVLAASAIALLLVKASWLPLG